MLNRDVLRIIFNFLSVKQSKNARLVCKQWNNILKIRFHIFHANNQISSIPVHCDMLVCDKRSLPILHPNIKKVIITDAIVDWDQDIDLFIIYTSIEYKQIIIGGKINDLVIGIFNHKLFHRTSLNGITFESFLNIDIPQRIIYDALCITSQLPREFQLNYPRKVIYLKPGTQINSLLIGASYLYLVDIDVDIKECYITGNKFHTPTIIIYKNGTKTEYNVRGHSTTRIDHLLRE